MIDLYKQGRMPFDKMIKYYPFEKINEAVADVEKGRTLKAILKF
jgi:aryl-alcohol dehydrogenase